MNKIIHDLISTREVVIFINNVIVETKKEEEHNKVVKEMIKRLVKNDLNSYAQASKINVEDIICIKDTFFFLNQQFIMWSAMAGHGNYLVATIH